MSALNAGIGFGALIGGIIVETFSLSVAPYLSILFAIICLGLALSIKRD